MNIKIKIQIKFHQNLRNMTKKIKRTEYFPEKKISTLYFPHESDIGRVLIK